MRLHVLLLSCVLLVLPVTGQPAANASGACAEVTWRLPLSDEQPVAGCSRDGIVCPSQHAGVPDDSYYADVLVCTYG